MTWLAKSAMSVVKIVTRAGAMTLSMGILIRPCAFLQVAASVGAADESAQTADSVHAVRRIDNPEDGVKYGTNIPQMPGWPFAVGEPFEFFTYRGAVFVDLDEDDLLEIVVATADHRVYAWDLAGTIMPGFPAITNGTPRYAPSVADMDGDGDPEIVQFTAGWLPDGSWLHVIDHLGSPIPGFPMEFGDARLATCPTLVDLDEDGEMEIVAAAMHSGSSDALHIIELNGSEWSGAWPAAIGYARFSTVSAGDVDADGTTEILCVTDDAVHLLSLDGSALAGWPWEPADGAGVAGRVSVLADVDADHDLEIICATSWGVFSDSLLHILHHDGSPHPGWPISLQGDPSPPTVTDLEGDGELEVIISSNCGFPTGIAALDMTGAVKPGFPYILPYGGGIYSQMTVADIDGDGLMEIFADYSLAQGEGFIFGVNSVGEELLGFPLRPWGVTSSNGATIGDVDSDGDYEIGVLSHYTEDYGDTWQLICNLYDLGDSYTVSERDWTVYHGSNRRCGLYPSRSSCVADVTGDGTVDVLDLLAVLSAWGQSGVPEDITGDGTVDVLDLLEVLGAWGPCE